MSGWTTVAAIVVVVGAGMVAGRELGRVKNKQDGCVRAAHEPHA